MMLSFIAAYLPAFFVGVDQNVLVEVKGVVPLQAGPHVKVGGDADGALLMHDVAKAVTVLRLPVRIPLYWSRMSFL